MTLYFVRHGLSEANKQGLWAGGHYETPLSVEGIEQAKIAGSKAAKNNIDFDLIVSSPRERALETAKNIAEQVGYPVEKIQVIDELKERMFGELDGKENIDLGPIHGKDETHVDRFEGVESMADFERRVTNILAELKKRPEETILIVSHAAFGRALKRAVAGVKYDKNAVTSFELIPNAKIVKLI